jgi:hypothetical protein
MSEVQGWLARLHHDLVKRALWPARDRRDLGGPVRPGELSVRLPDDEGREVSPGELWRALRAEAPAEIAPGALDAFAAAVAAAEAGAARDDLQAVLALEAAFDLLSKVARNVKGVAAPTRPSGAKR